MKNKNSIFKPGYEVKGRLALTGIALGVAGLVCLGVTSTINQNKRNEEMAKFGYTHLLPTKIEYANGYEAEGFDDNKDGTLDRIVVKTSLIGDSPFGDVKTGLGISVYKKGNEKFSGIEQDILGKSQPVSAKLLFKEAIVSATVTQLSPHQTFKDITIYTNAPAFTPRFEGISSKAAMPIVKPLAIKEIVSGARVELMFPGGKNLVPTYGIGIPFGVESPFMDTKTQLEKEKEE